MVHRYIKREVLSSGQLMRKLTGYDINHLLSELELIQGSILRKAYSDGDSLFGLSLYPGAQGKRDLLIDLRGYAFLTNKKWSWPQTPPPLAMKLRKHLNNRRIVRVFQPRMERIIEIIFLNNIRIIFELFNQGNLVLVEGETIKAVKSKASYADRELKEGSKYTYPPSESISVGSEEDVIEALKNYNGEVWRALIRLFGIGPPYIDEICDISRIDPKVKVAELGERLADLAESVYSLITAEPKPVVYVRGDKVVNFSVIPLSTLLKQSLELREVKSFSDAIELFYLDNLVIGKVEDQRIASLKHEVERQIELKDNYMKKAEELMRKGDLIYQHLYNVKMIIDSLRSGGRPENLVSIDVKRHKAVVKLGDVNVELDYLLTPQENASNYYQKAKRLREKASRVDLAIESLKKKIRELERSAQDRIESSIPRERRKRRWFEKFRWFYTSSGKLVLIGRDQQTNRELVSKYMGEKDLFFHVDMPGGAVVVLKLDGCEPDQESIIQAATAAGVYSRAWREGLSTADVYYVWGKQVSKHAPPGMYIPKGSFYILGKRNYLKVKLVICVGLQELEGEFKLTGAPPGVPLVSRICLVPGFMSKEKVAKLVVDRLSTSLKRKTTDKNKKGEEPIVKGVKVTIDDVMRVLPSGKFKVLE